MLAKIVKVHGSKSSRIAEVEEKNYFLISWRTYRTHEKRGVILFPFVKKFK